MTDLRKAAEMALEALRNAEIVKMEQLEAMYALQEALAQKERVTEITRQFVGVNEDGSERWVETEYHTVIKSEWVGLTDEEAADLWADAHDIDGKMIWTPAQLFEEIERRLKEKNA